MSVSPYMPVLEKIQQELLALVECLKGLNSVELSPSPQNRDEFIKELSPKVRALTLEGWEHCVWTYTTGLKTRLMGSIGKEVEVFLELDQALQELKSLLDFIKDSLEKGYLWPYSGPMLKNPYSRGLLKEVDALFSKDKNWRSRQEFLNKNK